MSRPEALQHPSLATSLWRIVFAVLCLALSSLPAEAQQVRAAAGFSKNVTEMGARLQFQIQIVGAEQPVLPDLHVDGLRFDYVGPRSLSMSFNGRASLSITHVYEVTPLRPGDFTVPALEILADGQRVRTQPTALKVLPRTNIDREPSSEPTGGIDISIVPSKTSVYLGERLPVEVQILSPIQSDVQMQDRPEMEADGFTASHFDGGSATRLSRGNNVYKQIRFYTILTPVRAGKLSIGPAKATVFPKPNRGDDDDAFPGFGNLFRRMGPREPQSLVAPKVELTVKPLPAAGRPASFRGAVGQFNMELGSVPDHVKLNDPLTMKFTVSGTGNFERLTAPVLADPKGWRVYPATEAVTADQSGLSGTKTFEVAVIPETKQTHLPVFELAYFDPSTEKYVTLKNADSPLSVEGELPPPTPATRALPPMQAGKAAATPAAATPVPAPKDILSIRYDAGGARSARPLYQSPIFWGAQLVPLAVVGVMLARRYRRPDTGRRQALAWRRERSELLARLRREQDRQAFYDTAARVLQIEAALRTGREPETIDAATVRRVAPREDESAAVLTEIFETRAEAHYAGSAKTSGTLTPPERDRVLGAVETWQRALA